MVGVDAFVQQVFSYTMSRKVKKWPIRIVESCISYGLGNARAAFCVRNKLDFTKYSMKEFYLDILREHYPPVFKISTVKLELKVQSPTYRKCIWTNCKKTTKILCNNQNCQKLACRDHMVILCSECYNHSTKDIITKTDRQKNLNSVVCKIKKFCKVKSTVTCASKSCGRVACANHRHFICLDCCCMHLSSVLSNYSEKITRNYTKKSLCK